MCDRAVFWGEIGMLPQWAQQTFVVTSFLKIDHVVYESYVYYHIGLITLF